MPACVLTLCDPVDCSPPGSSVHGIVQARILEWVAMAFLRGSSQPGDWTCISCIAGRFVTHWATWEACTCHIEQINQCSSRGLHSHWQFLPNDRASKCGLQCQGLNCSSPEALTSKWWPCLPAFPHFCAHWRLSRSTMFPLWLAAPWTTMVSCKQVTEIR